MAESNSNTKAPAKKAAAKKSAPPRKSANPYTVPEEKTEAQSETQSEETQSEETTETDQDESIDPGLLGETVLTYAPSVGGAVVVPAIVTRVNESTATVDLYVLPSFGGSESRHYTNVSMVDAEPDEPGVISANRCAWTR